MSGYLLDTNVISELRKGARANASVVAWIRGTMNEEHFISVLVLGELRKGIELIRKRDEAQAAALARWLGKMERDFSGKILPVTMEIADQWGRLAAIRPLPVIDGLMAATALTHSLTLVTRNASDVQHTGVVALNPF